MSLRELPEAKTFPRPANFHADAPSSVLEKWSEQPLAAESDDDNVVSIFDVIGEDFWTGGFTPKRMSAALRRIGPNPARVRINSPGGDMFDGIAIYNMLRQHPAEVTIEVVGWAASAASIIAMAGDEIRMGLGTFMMIHDAWGVVIGNRHDMRGGSELFEQFDSAIADIYEARTGMKRADIETMMDDETFMAPAEAVKNGFADVVDSDLTVAEAENTADNLAILARRQAEASLAKDGYTREQRSAMLAKLMGAPRDASSTAARDAGVDVAAVQQLIDTIKS